MIRTCPTCSEPVPVRPGPGRSATYCSSRCRLVAHRAKSDLPAELRERDRWVSWVPSKRPVQADGSPASSTDPSTWTTYGRVRGLERKGFVLGDGIGCIDLDYCLVDGRLTESAAAFLANVPSTYVEVSPSGTGLHVWGYIAEGRGSRRTVDGLSVERYSVGRYITVTGRPFAGSVTTLADLSGI